MNKERDILTAFVERMKLLNIEVKLSGNVPWIYLDYINGKRVKKEDYYLGNHGFTIAFYPLKPGRSMKFTDIKKIIELIRKYK
jgi:hypothetical protein